MYVLPPVFQFGMCVYNESDMAHLICVPPNKQNRSATRTSGQQRGSDGDRGASKRRRKSKEQRKEKAPCLVPPGMKRREGKGKKKGEGDPR